jgi:Ca2+-binding RTX toxin-like protein
MALNPVPGDVLPNSLIGTPFHDLVTGEGGNDTIFGEDGNDELFGGQDDDQLFGGTGDDSHYGGDGHDIIFDDRGNNTIWAGAGNDQVRLELSTGPFLSNTVYGEDGDDLVTGSNRRDVVFGGADEDFIYGNGGRDLLSGGDDNDALFGGDGNDVLMGGADNDQLWGEYGDDRLLGDAGHDVLHGDSGNDQLFGGAGNDSLFSGAPWHSDNDSLFGGGGRDHAHFYSSSRGHFDGGAGRRDLVDLFLYTGMANYGDISLDLTQSLAAVAVDGQTRITLTNVEILHLQGSDGDDTILSGSGDDIIHVQLGMNSVSAGAGKDLVSFAVGEINHLDGGAGNADMIRIINVMNAPWSFDASTGITTDGNGSVLSGFESVHAIAFFHNDTLRLSQGNDIGEGWNGNDTLFGESGNDRLQGGDGNDHLDGGDDHDRLAGGNGEDVLVGGAGNDILTGGLGVDTLTGGSGEDTFRLIAGGPDSEVIADFVSGQDRLVIRTAIVGPFLDEGPIGSSDLTTGDPVDSRPQFFTLTGPTGNLFLHWDPDGSGTGPTILLAELVGPASLSFEDISIG